MKDSHECWGDGMTYERCCWGYDLVMQPEKTKLKRGLKPRCGAGLMRDRTDRTCCEKRCGECDTSDCEKRPGGAGSCCTKTILAAKRTCEAVGDAPPCVHTEDLADVIRSWRQRASPEDILSWLDDAVLKKVTLLDDVHLYVAFGRADERTEKLVVQEMQVDDYGLTKLAIPAGGNVVDLGSHVGIVAMVLKRLFPRARVLAFEPTPPNRFYFELNLALNNIVAGKGGVEIRSEAVAAGPRRQLTMSYSAVETTGGSLYHSDLVTQASLYSVSTISIADILAEVGGRIDFLKLDCEGCEYGLLDGDFSAVLGKIAHAAGEVHPRSWALDEFGWSTINRTHVELCRRRWNLQDWYGSICLRRGGHLQKDLLPWF
eukprot:TRINITY_DN60443_c0_g1_i1.p1 TRINITY_DN60443_c0_g1~~TRINITY_DN60443_c0_g1_i1.p1  ORF type:complete len:433 (-),score=57.72 TRINITY_DN60443_c0_g1_i1:539-1657(-)